MQAALQHQAPCSRKVAIGRRSLSEISRAGSQSTPTPRWIFAHCSGKVSHKIMGHNCKPLEVCMLDGPEKGRDREIEKEREREREKKIERVSAQSARPDSCLL